MKNYNKENIEKAKSLRKNMTPWERKLWHLFLKTYPIRIQRQKSIGNYIVDFYCAKARLIIELDGSGHSAIQQESYDKKRDLELKNWNFTSLRIPNLDIDRNFKSVCEMIDMEIKKNLP